jgi:ATP-dependent exoDNAse (exonuclease V) beta subunit
MTESLCLLYVALTRARQGLHVMIMPPEKGEFKTKKPAALIYHALGCADHFAGDPTEGGQVLFESGQPRWWDKG